VDVTQGSHGILEAIAIAVTVVVHLIKRHMLISMAVGTACYMVLVQFIF
jgi:branched-subunit amino acid transport protein AzlD